MTENWKQLAAHKKAQQQASIPKEWILENLPTLQERNVLDFPETCGLLTSQEVEITKTRVDILLNKLASAEWSSVAVMTAFGKRAIIAHQLVGQRYFKLLMHPDLITTLCDPYFTHLLFGQPLKTNCLTEIFIERALVRAAELDAHLKATGTTFGPLHGESSFAEEKCGLPSSIGLPISLKDQVSIKGIESTTGMPWNSVQLSHFDFHD